MTIMPTEATNGQIELDTKLVLGTDGWATEFEYAQLGRNGRTVESQNAFVYRFEGDSIEKSGFSTRCLGGQGRIAVVISNLPTGDLTFLDADYQFQLTNTGNKKK